MINELAAALNEIIAQAAPASPEPTTKEAFAALLAGTTPAPAPRHPVRCPRTGRVLTFAHTTAEAAAISVRLAA